MPSNIPMPRLHGLLAGLAPSVIGLAAAGATLDVCPDGSCDFTSVRAAVLASSDGDVIRVHPGNYVLPAGQEIDIFDRSLTIRGVGAVAGIVLQGAAGAGIFDVRGGVSDRVVLENLTIFGGATSVGGGVYAENVELIVEGCHFEANLADAGGAVATSDAVVEFDTCRFTRNDAFQFGGAVYASGGAVRFVDCLVDDNLSDEGGGIASAFCDMDLVRCRLVENTATSGGAMIVNGVGATIPVLVDSLICGSGAAPVAGPIVDSGGSNTFTNVCRTCDGQVDAIGTWTDPSSDCNGDGRIDACQVAEGSLEDRNLNDIPDACEDPVVFDVPGVFETISDAIAAARGGAVIQIAGGVYNERLDLGSKDLQIVGDPDSPETVILDGTGLGDSILVATGGQTAAAKISGLTFRNGTSGHVPGFARGIGDGGAIYLDDVSIKIVDCVFRDNAGDRGGAIRLSGGGPQVKRCRFEGNQAARNGGAIFASNASGLQVKDCVIEGGVAGVKGGGLLVRNTSGIVENTTIRTSIATESGGGMLVAGDSTISILGCVVESNASLLGGGIMIEPGPLVSIQDCVLATNEPTDIDGDFEDLGGNEIGDDDPPTCTGDFDGDGSVGGSDLGIMLVEYGRDCDPDDPCQADLDGDGTVTGADLGLLLVAWGVCP